MCWKVTTLYPGYHWTLKIMIASPACPSMSKSYYKCTTVLLPWSKNSDKKVVAKLIRLPCPRDIKLGENIVPDLTTVFVKKRKRKMNYDWQEKKNVEAIF